MQATKDPDLEKWILARFLEFDPPEGFRAELIEGEIVLVPPPSLSHNNVVSRIARQIWANCPEMGTWTETGVATPRGHYIPDMVSAPQAWGDKGGGSWMSPDEVELVVEVTSTRPEDDRLAKRLGYAEAGIPLYLLVDRERGECVLRAKPKNGDYQSYHRVLIGEEIPLPQPFGFVLLTSTFPK